MGKILSTLNFENYVADTLTNVRDYEKILFKKKNCLIPSWRAYSLNNDFYLNPDYSFKKIREEAMLIFPKKLNIWKLLKKFFKESIIRDYDTSKAVQFVSKFRDIKMIVDTSLAKPGFKN